MKFLLVTLLIVSLIYINNAQESEKDDEDVEKDEESGWWTNFKKQVKSVLTKWRDDLRVLWDQVLDKASDMRTWTAEMFESFKQKFKEYLDSKPDMPEDEKNDIENFISKLKLPTDSPKSS